VVTALCAVVFVAAGCTDDSPDAVPAGSPTTTISAPVSPGADDEAVLRADRDVPVSPAAIWTVLVYINGRNDLDGRAAAALDQLAQLQPNPGSVNIVALAGRTGASGRSGGGLQPFDSVKLLTVDGSGALAELADFGTVAMGQPGALREFLSNGIELFPSQRLGLIVVGPGAGWQGMSTDTTGTSVDQLSVPELAGEISQGLADRRHDPIDLVALDGSLMASYEVAAALTDTSSVLVAAEGPAAVSTVDLAGLRAVAGTDLLDGHQLGRALMNAPAGPPDAPAPSIIDLARFTSLRTSVEQWSVAVAALLERQGEQFVQAASRPAPLAWSPAAGGDSGAVDLSELTESLGAASPELAALGANVVAELRAAVQRPVDDPLDRTGGLSIYVPMRSAVDTSYSSVESAGGWRAVIESLGRLSASAPAFAPETVLSTTAPPPPYTFSAPLTAETVTRAGVASATIGVVTASSSSATGTTSPPSSVNTTTARVPIAFSVSVPATVDAAGVVRAQWDARRLLAVAGSTTDPVWLDVAGTRAGVVTVPFAAVRGDSSFAVVARVRFDPSSNSASGVQYFRIGVRGDWSPLTDLTGVSLTPVLRVEQPSGPPTWVESGQPIAAVAAIDFRFAALDAQASFGVRLTVGGRGDGSVSLVSVVTPAAVAASSDASTSTTSVAGDLSGASR